MASVARTGKRRNAYKILLEKPEVRDYLEDVDVRWRR